MTGQLEELLGEGDLRLGGEEVGDVAERLELLCHGLEDRGVCMAQRVDGDAAEQVEVLLAVGIPDVGALAAYQHGLRRPERVHDGALVAGRPVGDSHFWSFVTLVE